MSRTGGPMLRTRRKDNNVKPNRRLDRKSSRGMIYENEELRLRTININAEVERGQSDIKKLRRENEMLKKEIWCLRDGYDKLERLIKEKGIESSSSTTTCSSDSESSCSSCTEDCGEVETSQNLENVQKTNLKNLHSQFNHLSVVPEENSAENSERTSNRTSVPNDVWIASNQHGQITDVIPPDQSYPQHELTCPKHFFSPINKGYADENSTKFPDYQQTEQHFRASFPQEHIMSEDFYQAKICPTIGKTSSDLIAKTDNCNFRPPDVTPSLSTFSNGGNLEELLNDIETISRDILNISSNAQNHEYVGGNQNASTSNLLTQETGTHFENDDCDEFNKPYKTELNVVLMPTPMPLIGFEKYKNVQKSCENIDKCIESMSTSCQNLMLIASENENEMKSPSPFMVENPIQVSSEGNERIALDELPPPIFDQDNPFVFGKNEDCLRKTEEKMNFLEVVQDKDRPKSTTEESKSSGNDKKDLDKNVVKSPKMSIKRKVSIHFKGKKDKKEKNDQNQRNEKKRIFDLKFGNKNSKTPTNDLCKKKDPDPKKTEKVESVTTELKPPEIKADRTMSLPNYTTKPPDAKNLEKKVRKSISVSPDRKHVHMKDEGKKCSHKKHKRSGERRTRRSSVSTDRYLRERSFSVCTDRSNILDHRLGLGFGSSFLYDDCNSDSRSLSSCDTIKTRKMSNISNLPINGKIPWCGCWGNGCI